ncbi:facilitated trehalose transporter Tret1-like [Panulirus ornatus]|uniref:facilitated trehalose transporter Tret1-like n=1 Tax=Panulirus ornatus TaxID=150431 RepID=UPI003A853696
MTDATPREESPMGPLARQAACALVVSGGMFPVGLSLGWPVVLPGLQSDNSTSFNITNNDVKWLVSSSGMVGMLTNLCIGTLMESLGPRRLLRMVLLPGIVFWLTQAFTPSRLLLYVGRLGGVLVCNILTTLICPLLVELLEPDNRGLLCCLPEIMVSLGVMVVYLLAHQLSWRTVTALCATPFLPLFLFSLVIPESPFWLVRRGKIQAAERALVQLRGPAKYKKSNELAHIRRSIQECPQATITDQLKQLRLPHHMKPVALLVFIFVLRELGGQYAVFTYTLYLFQQAGLHVDAFTCTILVGVARLVATLASSLFLDRVGRRSFLTGTCGVCAVAAAVGGAFLLAEVPRASWVPLAAVLIFVLSYGLGVGPIPWILQGELPPTPVRSVGASITTFFFAVSMFVVGYIFPELMSVAGVGGSLLVFAVFNALLTVVVWFFLPETGGRFLHQLQEVFIVQPPPRPLADVTTFADAQDGTPDLASSP